MKAKFLPAIAAAILLAVPCVADTEPPAPDGWLLWHSYSSYDAGDSKLFCAAPGGTVTELRGDFRHAMNGDFGMQPYDIVFMAIDPAADEWDIFRADLLHGTIVNLTEHSGLRNEDPKFSPDGSKIVFKRGRWSQELDGFVYQLAEMQLATGEIRLLPVQDGECSMPYYSSDGTEIFYALSKGGQSSIWCMDAAGETRCVADVPGVYCYYPVVRGDALWFTRWYDAAHHVDAIARLDDAGCAMLPFCTPAHDASDPCPLPDGGIIYSSDAAGSYDLMRWDGENSYPLTSCNTDRQELGAAFFSKADAAAFLAEVQDALLGRIPVRAVYDTDKNGAIDVRDLTVIQRAMYRDQ